MVAAIVAATASVDVTVTVVDPAEVRDLGDGGFEYRAPGRYFVARTDGGVMVHNE